MESIKSKLALYGSKHACVRTDTAFLPISEVCDGTVSITHCSLYSVQCRLYTVYCTVYTVNSTQYIVHCTLYTVHSVGARVTRLGGTIFIFPQLGLPNHGGNLSWSGLIGHNYAFGPIRWSGGVQYPALLCWTVQSIRVQQCSAVPESDTV